MKSKMPLYVFLLFFVIFVIGILMGDANDVFQKGVAICLSCIGID